MTENGSQEKELTDSQLRAITVLLEGLPTLEVLKSAKCSERTLYRWKQDDVFISALHAARLALLETATAKLRQRASDAVDTLHALLACDKPAVQARAAEAILSHAYRAAETEDIAYRLAAIEKQLEAQEGAKKRTVCRAG